MTRLAIGDIHGRTFWKKYLDEDFTEFYFTGDYFDSFDVPFSGQIDNFRELCESARTDPRIKLCLGNHDYQYLGRISPQRYSGFQEKNKMYISEILEQHINLLKILYTTPDRYLISHAGVSHTFMRKMERHGVANVEGINEAFLQDRDILTFNGYNMYGDDVTQSPIWIRPRSLESDPLAGYCQIVGHTPGITIRETTVKKGRAEIKLIYIDTGDIESVYRF
ncbi:MAG: metallophosphoesterase [Treponema sp.]|jgi:hypothetical protein|nr:metallophosphoesterase [Treponema sp.]